MCHPPCPPPPPRATREELPRGAGSRSNHVSLCVIFYSGNASSEGSLLGDEGKIMTKCCKPGAPARGSRSSQTCLIHLPQGHRQACQLPPPLHLQRAPLPSWPCRHVPATTPQCWPQGPAGHTHGHPRSADTLQPQHPFHAGRSPPGTGVQQLAGSLTEGERLRSPRVGVGPSFAGADPDKSLNHLLSLAALARPAHQNPGSTSTEAGAA